MRDVGVAATTAAPAPFTLRCVVMPVSAYGNARRDRRVFLPFSRHPLEVAARHGIGALPVMWNLVIAAFVFTDVSLIAYFSAHSPLLLDGRRFFYQWFAAETAELHVIFFRATIVQAKSVTACGAEHVRTGVIGIPITVFHHPLQAFNQQVHPPSCDQPKLVSESQ
jgi:hypothetical protein